MLLEHLEDLLLLVLQLRLVLLLDLLLLVHL